ncbi:helix-hairpin-helix domain-containing protein [Pedobacter sp. P351]|uniref:ComEA family DNA-binding protein n=1 Tax=Pedobacter superstes TaxID=3133441 RepID=UPI0030971AB9
MSFKLVLLTSLLVFSQKVKSQTETDLLIEQIIEPMFESTSEDFDYSEIVERLNYYNKNPFNLNKVTADQLKDLVFLSPLQINELIRHRTNNGDFMEIYELQSIDGMDLETIKKLLLFCNLTEINPFINLSFKTLVTKGTNEVMFTYGQTLQKKEGFIRSSAPDSYYLGGSERFLSRYRYHFEQAFSASLTMEKDAGEAFFSQSQSRGFDFYSGNISYKGFGRIKKLVVGDFSLQFGQGLTMWSGLSFGKGAAVATVAKNNIGLKPYTSTNESLFLRGLASTVNFRKIDFTPFLSYRFIDGGLEADGDTEEISSINNTGFHRTQNEINNKNSIKQLIYGANLNYSNKSLRLGTTAYQTEFNYPFEPGQLPYNKFRFSGNKLTNVGAYYSYNWHNFYFFGEGGHSLNSGFAFLNGLISSLTPKISLVLFHRDYQKNYHSFFNQAVSEGTAATNEQGFYSGLAITPNKKFEYNIYADFFKFPWLRYRVDAPSSGYEIFSQFSFSPSKRLKAMLRYKFENKEENDVLDNTINYLSEVRKQNFRFEINYKISDGFQFRNRAEMVDYKKDDVSEKGFLMYQDLIYNPMSSRISGNFRFAIFDTPGFNSRLYAFENDVLYSYSVPAYQNKGLRFYLNSRVRVSPATDIWFKYALSYYSDVESIGSGLDKIEGNKKSDIKFQLRFQF